MFVTNAGTAIPIANTLDIFGGTVVAGTSPVSTTGALNVVTINVQRSQAIAATDSTKIGLSAFDSADFTVDANGFVSLAGGGAAETLTGNSGGAVGPTLNNINTLGTGSITIAGNPGTSTLTTQLTGLTNHSLLVGAGTATITNLGVASNGQLPIGSVGADPVLANITSAGSTIVITNGAGTISLDVNGALVGETITGNSGGALSPTAGNWNILGASTAAGTSPVTTAGAVSTLTVNVQKAQAIAATDATKVGLAAFDSAEFTVDANGFVSLAGGGLAIDSIGTQTGTNPIVPTAGGLVTINGAVVAAGTNPVRSDGTGANTMAIEVQISQALAATDATKIGLSNFDSARFTVDANGFVSTSGTGVLNTLTGNSGGAISPTAGNINTVGTGSITIAGAGSTLTTQLTGLTNHAVLVGAGTATITNVGPTATVGQVLQSAGAAADPAFSTATYPLTTTVNEILFSSATNTVTGLATANRAVLTTGATGIPVLTALATDGQLIIGSTAGVPAAATISAGTGISITNGSNSISIAVNGSVVGETITGNSGGALSPTAGNWNIVGTGSTTASGSGSTLTVQMTGLTNHNVLLGAGTATITNLAPSATSGVPLISQGAAADPAFGTAVVAGGGTGNTTFTAYSVICAGTTATGTFQNVSGVGTSGQVLTSNGAAALPTWQTQSAAGSINIQVFTANGTYTPTSGMDYCIIECVGGGGGGGGSASASVAFFSCGGGGGGGGYARKFASAATIGASQTVTIGAAGTAGTAGNNAGGAGGDTSVGAICIGKGGSGGGGNAGNTVAAFGAGGVAGTGDATFPGGAGSGGNFTASSSFALTSYGGNSFFGTGASARTVTVGATGVAGSNYGGGGGGGISLNAGATQAGGAGTAGYIVITEYI